MNAYFKVILFCLLLGLTGCAGSSGTGRRTHEEIGSARGIVLKDPERLSTLGRFKPPVEIVIVVKTDSTNLRMAYAADQVIFNWEIAREELRVDGGPADGRHKAGAGLIPPDKYVTIRWSVTPRHQAIYVDDELRYEQEGDYSGIDKIVSVFPAVGSRVTVKSIKVKQLGVLPESQKSATWYNDIQ
jgi:hypothetical protein